MSEYFYGYGTATPRKPIPWKDREGYERYFSEVMSKYNHLTTQQVMEYDMSVRQLAHAAYLAEREADPSLPIRYPTINGLNDQDEDAHFCMSPDVPEDDGLSDQDDKAYFCLSDGDPEEIMPVITQGSSSPNSIDVYSPTEATILWKTKKNPSPHAFTDASTKEDAKNETDPSLPCRYSTKNGLGDNGDDEADFCLIYGDPEEEIIPVITEGSSSPNSTDKYSPTEGMEAVLWKTKKNPSPHASTDASTEEDEAEAATFGEAKKYLHFLPCDSPPDYASVIEIAKFKRKRNNRRRMMNKRRRMMNKRKRMMNLSRNFPYKSFYLLKRKASTAGMAS